MCIEKTDWRELDRRKEKERKLDLKMEGGAPLVEQWLRIRLPMLVTRVRALVREDPTCRRAAKPTSHNY